MIEQLEPQEPVNGGIAMGSEVLTFKEATELLRISAPTLRELSVRGTIPARKLGKQWRYNRQFLLDYLSGKSHVSRSIGRKK